MIRVGLLVPSSFLKSSIIGIVFRAERPTIHFDQSIDATNMQVFAHELSPK